VKTIKGNYDYKNLTKINDTKGKYNVDKNNNVSPF
jgi:hypothetical protein